MSNDKHENPKEKENAATITRTLVNNEKKKYRDYFMVGECVRFLFTSCKGSLSERVSAANE